MHPQNVAKRLRDIADIIERDDAVLNGHDAFVVDLEDYGLGAVALTWCDGFGPIRPWRMGDPLPV